MKSIVRVFVWAMSVLSVVCILSWHLNLSFFLKLPPATWPLPYVSAWCLLLSGLSFFLLFGTTRFQISNILGLVIFLFGFQRTSEILFPNNFILSSTYFHPIRSSQMVLTAAIGFMLMGLLFILWSKLKKPSRDIALLLASSLMIFLGLFGIVIHLVPISIHEELQKVLLHFYTSIGLFLIGFGFLIARFHTFNPLQQEKK